MIGEILARRRTRTWLAATTIVIILGVLAGAATFRRGGPDVPMVDVTRSEFVDVVELRGEVRPITSKALLAPAFAGDLQIIKLAKANSAVKAGDLVVEFDATTLQRTRQDQSSWRSQCRWASSSACTPRCAPRRSTPFRRCTTSREAGRIAGRRFGLPAGAGESGRGCCIDRRAGDTRRGRAAGRRTRR